MAERADSPAGGLFVKQPSEALCLDFANTRYWRGSEEPTEELGDFAALLRWCRARTPLPFALPRLDPGRDFAAAIDLREAIYRSFLTRAEGRRPKDADLALIGDGRGRALRRLGIARKGGDIGWRVLRPGQPGIETLLSPVLWSAWDLLLGPSATKVKRCANERCRYLFLDLSKAGTRRWCSMASCGNRAKAHRHYVKHKAKKA